jgi:hypothetical protein
VRDNFLYGSAIGLALAWAAGGCGAADGPTGSPSGTGGRGGSGESGGAGTGGAAGSGGTVAGTGGAAAGSGGSGGGVGGGQPDGGGATGGAGGATGSPADFTIVGLATWKYDAKAAYTIIHDDVGNYPSITTFVVDEMTKRGLSVGLGCIAGVVKGSASETAKLKVAVQNGHEVLSHSYSHNYVKLSNVDTEVTAAQQTLEQIFGIKVTFFIYPYDSREDDVAKFVAMTHLGDRSGYNSTRDNRKGVNPPDFDDYDTGFETSGQDTTPPANLNKYVDEAIAAGGWGQRELHGIGDGSYNHISKETYTTHMDYLKTKFDAGELWTAPPTAVIKYKHMRKGACGQPMANGNVIAFPMAGAAECVTYAAPVSIVVKSAAADLAASQAGKMLEVIKKPDRFVINADPTGGDVSVTSN